MLHGIRLLDVSEVPYHTHILLLTREEIDIISILDRRMVKFLFNLINHCNIYNIYYIIRNINFKFSCPRSTLVENYKYIIII